jgi:hypothetical protein
MKLTLVSITHNGRKHRFWLRLRYVGDRAQISPQCLNGLLNHIGVRRGDTYSIG